MVDKKTIAISSILPLVIALGLLVPGFFDTPQFYCEAESSIIECPGGLSGGSGTRCYLNEEKTSWDYCSSGWYEITDDRLIQEEPGTVPGSTTGDKCWQCSNEGCIAC